MNHEDGELLFALSTASSTAPVTGAADTMTRYEVYRIVIRALNQKMGRVTRKATRDELSRARDWLANDPAFEWDLKFGSDAWREVDRQTKALDESMRPVQWEEIAL